MEEQRPQLHRSDFPPKTGERTPTSVKQLVEELSKRLEKLEQQHQDLQNQQQVLQEQLNRKLI